MRIPVLPASSVPLGAVPLGAVPLGAVPLGAVLLGAALLLAGCAGDASGETTATPTVSAASAELLGFDDGAALDPAWDAQWLDAFYGDDTMIASGEDADTGAWSYISEDTQCIVTYWQGALDGADLTLGDLTLSDWLLASQFDSDTAAVAEYADDSVPLQGINGEIAARSVVGMDDGTSRTYIIAARAFAALDAGVLVTFSCPAAFVIQDEWDALAADPGAFTVIVGDFAG